MDNIELDNLDKPEKEPEEQQEQETNIDDDDWRDQSIVIIDTSNQDAKIPNPRKDAGIIRRAYIEDKKNLLRAMGFNIKKGDRPSAKAVVVLDCYSGLKSTRRPRGAPFPRAMRGFVSQILPPCQRFHAASTQRAKNTCHAWKGYHFFTCSPPPGMRVSHAAIPKGTHAV